MENKTNEELNSQEAVNNEDEKNIEVEELAEDNIPTVDDYNNLARKNKELYARVKKAESEAKAKREAEKNIIINKKDDKSDIDLENLVDERLLRRENYSDEEIKLLRDIQSLAKLNGRRITLDDCRKEALFSSHLAAKQQEETKRKAQLGASGGSQYASSEASFPKNKEGRLDRDAFKQKFSQVNQ